jgi:hypothetical protein
LFTLILCFKFDMIFTFKLNWCLIWFLKIVKSALTFVVISALSNYGTPLRSIQLLRVRSFYEFQLFLKLLFILIVFDKFLG